ncbi:Subtilase family protein [Pedobacter hartonius]|uniref:Subtilase family protein n=2 Tax=Pedobacter hartonius TaxID=425514 RepID=A0A1H4HJC9_9SPHI|nr:Subtilase family protein [Pedobacter hartonius]
MLILLTGRTVCAQQVKMMMPKPNWYNLDLKTDSMFGISMDRAYQELLKGKKPEKVIVAVIDGGMDAAHEDLKRVVWTNPKEIPGNGKDDDKNGYIDDVHGWNFMGSGKDDFEFDNDYIVLELRKYTARFGEKDSSAIAKDDLPEYRKYISQRKELTQKLEKLNKDIENSTRFFKDLEAVLKKIGKENPTLDDFNKLVPANDAEAKIKQFMIPVLGKNPDFRTYVNQAKTTLEDNRNKVQYNLNLQYDPRAKYANEYPPVKEGFYGNPNVYGTVAPAHGTHVAGIVGADRNNNTGISGVADAVQIMPIRAIPDGYGLDIDQANSIRYAADNGAKVINMSFGLNTLLDRKAVEEAVKYALSKDILFIQAAGNGHENLDNTKRYPSREKKEDQDFVDAFIKVGASGFADNEQLAVPFSNYGKQTVDVFAPGLGINSTIPGNGYEAHSGTSMAAPIVAGLAAVIREYYPKLTAKQVKEIIVKSVVKRDALRDLCISGGVVNAFNAIQMAESYK